MLCLSEEPTFWINTEFGVLNMSEQKSNQIDVQKLQSRPFSLLLLHPTIAV